MKAWPDLMRYNTATKRYEALIPETYIGEPI
jgi:hypothetical protein